MATECDVRILCFWDGAKVTCKISLRVLFDESFVVLREGPSLSQSEMAAALIKPR